MVVAAIQNVIASQIYCKSLSICMNLHAWLSYDKLASFNDLESGILNESLVQRKSGTALVVLPSTFKFEFVFQKIADRFQFIFMKNKMNINRTQWWCDTTDSNCDFIFGWIIDILRRSYVFVLDFFEIWPKTTSNNDAITWHYKYNDKNCVIFQSEEYQVTCILCKLQRSHDLTIKYCEMERFPL